MTTKTRLFMLLIFSLVAAWAGAAFDYDAMPCFYQSTMERLLSAESRLFRHDARLEKIDARLEKIEGRLEKLEAGLEMLEKNALVISRENLRPIPGSTFLFAVPCDLGGMK